MPLALAAAAALTAGAAMAQSYEDLPPELEIRAHSLYGRIMCPQCAGQTIDQSHAPVAETMRDLIRAQLRAGASDGAIVDLLVGAYGEGILASPPTRGFSLAVWLVPPTALVLGAGAVVVAVRSLRRTPSAAAVPGADAAPNGPDLDRLLDQVDRELGQDASREGPR